MYLAIWALTGLGLLLASKTDPVETVHALKRLIDSDVRIVIGPATSAAVMSVKDYANQHDVILISPSSTSAALSIADDNLFRFVPDDRNQADLFQIRCGMMGFEL
jgi:branched-chain amino acid transport system substrate-binding protein